MKKILSRSILSALFMGGLGLAAPAYAQCVSPASPEGGIEYDSAADQLLLCDGTNWLVVGPGGSGGTLDGLSDVDTSGVGTGNVIQFDGANWVDANITPNPQLSMFTGWPDAIRCVLTNSAEVFLYISNAPDSTGTEIRYSIGTTWQLDFDLAGDYSSHNQSLLNTADCQRSISQFYSDGDAFNFIGGATVAPETIPIDELTDAATDYTTDFNMFMGDGAGASIASGGQNNLLIGQNSGTAITTGDNNVALGRNTLQNITTGENNIAIGYNAYGASGSSTTAGNSLVIGTNALSSHNGTDGGAFVIGQNAAENATNIGGSSVVIGNAALQNATHIPVWATIIGGGAANNITGAPNSLLSGTVIGSQAGRNIAHAGNATIIGARVARGGVDATPDGSVIGSVIIGSDAAFNANGTNSTNVIIGRQAAQNINNASNNVLVGRQIANALTSGDENVVLGKLAAPTLTTGSRNIILGDQADVSSATVNDELNIGGTIYGDLSTDSVGIGALPGSGYELDVVGDLNYSGALTNISDRRMKTDIVPLDTKEMAQKIAQIDTYSYRKITDPDNKTELGVMAQELEKLFPELVNTQDDEMGTKSVNYIGLIPPLIEATKELSAENDALKNDVEDLKQQVALLNTIVSEDAGKKASAMPYMMLILLMIAGFGGILLLQRRKA